MKVGRKSSFALSAKCHTLEEFLREYGIARNVVQSSLDQLIIQELNRFKGESYVQMCKMQKNCDETRRENPMPVLWL